MAFGSAVRSAKAILIGVTGSTTIDALNSHNIGSRRCRLLFPHKMLDGSSNWFTSGSRLSLHQNWFWSSTESGVDPVMGG